MRHKRLKYLLATTVLFIAFPVPCVQAIPTDGIAAWWSFQGSADDVSGNGHHGTVYGATLTQDRFGNPNSAYYFDGLNDYINIGNGVKPYMPLTVAGWTRLDDPVTGNSFFRNDYVNGGSNRYGVLLSVGSGGYLDASMYEGFSAPWNRRGKTSSEAYGDLGTWHHVAAVFVSRNDIRLYWDGMPISGNYHGDGSGLSYSSGSGVVGHVYGASGVPYYFHGAIDDILVYGRALTDGEILDLFNYRPIDPIPAPGAILLSTIGAGLVTWLRRRRTI